MAGCSAEGGVVRKLSEEPDRGVAGDTGAKEASVSGNEGAIVLDGERDINAIPKRHLAVDSQIQSASD